MKNYYALNTRDSQSVQARRGGYTCSHGAWPNSKTGCHRLPPWIGSSNPSDDRDRFPRVTHTPRAAPAAPTVGTAASPRAALARRGIRPWPWAVGRGPGAGVLSSSRMNMTTDRERHCIYRYIQKYNLAFRRFGSFATRSRAWSLGRKCDMAICSISHRTTRERQDAHAALLFIDTHTIWHGMAKASGGKTDLY